MGWCSGTNVFDIACGAILNPKNNNIKDTLKEIITELEFMDWDCQQDSEFWNSSKVQEAFKELHPDWFEKE